jgi:hypothetical protein
VPSGAFIVPLTIDYWSLPKKHEGFIPRDLAPMSTFEIEPEPEPEEPNGGRSRKIEQKREQGQGRRFFD